MRLAAALKWANERPKRRQTDIAREANRRYRSRVLYELTIEELEAFRIKHGDRCGICGLTQQASTRALAIDHCHDTGRLRGLLCHKCNVGLGHFRDDHTLVRAALAYLEAAQVEAEQHTLRA